MDTAVTHFIAAVTEAPKGTDLFRCPAHAATQPHAHRRQGRWPPWGAVNSLLLRALASPRDNSEGPVGLINPLQNKRSGPRDGTFWLVLGGGCVLGSIRGGQRHRGKVGCAPWVIGYFPTGTSKARMGAVEGFYLCVGGGFQ